jgi:lysozyme family protein
MADFAAAFAKTSALEGKYANHPLDRGGETYRGIARRHHPDWPGWRAVDRAKHQRDFPRALERDKGLAHSVERFYRTRYWNRFGGDAIPNQAVAEELFDTSVHIGLPRGVRLLQRSLNLLNRNQSTYADITVDGLCGTKTRAALGKLLRADGKPDYLLMLMNVLQGAAYVETARRDPRQEAFLRGWLERL